MIEIEAQSYVGKSPILKGIGELYRGLWCAFGDADLPSPMARARAGNRVHSPRRACNRIADDPAKCSNLPVRETRDAL
jgi:hypothetical protein